MENECIVLKHRWVMANHIKREIRSDERIHHKNGIRNDNQIENLELCIKFQPPTQRVSDVLAYCEQIIERYKDIQLKLET